jgi:probable phosphoglycerate mutase
VIAFVRHGQTEANQAGRLQGLADAPLTDLGREQARRLAGYFPERAVARVLSSPLRRAVETAHAIAEAHAVDVELEPRLIELDYGDWDRIPIDQVPAGEWRRWRDDPEFAPPGGESLRTVTERVVPMCEELFAHGDDLVVAVSHVSPIKAAVCFALGVDERVSWRMQLDLASVTWIGGRPDGRPYLAGFNDIAHL